MRVIKKLERRTARGDVVKAVVYYHADWQEYYVRFFHNDKPHLMLMPARDLQDATESADWFVNKE